MIIKNNTNPTIERKKKRLGLSGDVYVYNHLIEDMTGHKVLFPESTAQTIEEAEAERIAYEEERARLAAEAAAQAAENLGEAETEETTNSEEESEGE